MGIGRKIAQLRKEKGITQEALAQVLNVTNQAVSKWESEQCSPDIQLLPELADFFGVSIDALFDRETASTVTLDHLPWEDDDVVRAVVYHGHKLLQNSEQGNAFTLKFDGPAKDIECAVNLECGDVAGNVNAGVTVNCGAVGGNVDAGLDVTCGDVCGNVEAGTEVNCGDVCGYVDAGQYVNCRVVVGNVDAGQYVNCGDVGGSVDAGEDVFCGGVQGNIDAGGSVTIKKNG